MKLEEHATLCGAVERHAAVHVSSGTPWLTAPIPSRRNLLKQPHTSCTVGAVRILTGQNADVPFGLARSWTACQWCDATARQSPAPSAQVAVLLR